MLPRGDSPYTRWAGWLGAFARGGEEPLLGLPAMDPEALGGAAVARLVERSSDALRGRLEVWLAALRRDLERARTPADYTRALGDARRRLAPVRAFTESELLLPELREALARGLAENLDSFQSTLEDESRRDPLAGETLLRVVRDNPLNRALALDLGPSGDAGSPAPEQSRRPILLG